MPYNPLNLDPTSREPLKTSLEKLDVMASELYGIIPAGVDLSAYGANIVPGTDDQFTLGTPTHRWASLYVGPNSLHIGDATITATTDGNLTIPGITESSAYQAVNVISAGISQNDVWQNPPVVIDAMTFLNYTDSVTYPVPVDWVPAVYQSQITGSGFISNINILNGGNQYTDVGINGVQNVATICTDTMYAAVAGTSYSPGMDPGDWNPIPFSVESGGTGVKLTQTISADFEPDWGNITNKPTFATVATSGDYSDLLNPPTIPADVGDLTDTGGLLGGGGADLSNVTGAIQFTDGLNNDTTKLYADGYDVAIPNILNQQLTFESDITGTLTDGVQISQEYNNSNLILKIEDVTPPLNFNDDISLVGGSNSLNLGGNVNASLYRWNNAYLTTVDTTTLIVNGAIRNTALDLLIDPTTTTFYGTFIGSGNNLTDVEYSNVVNGPTGTFSTIAVSGQTSVAADAINDTLTLVAGAGIALTTNEAGDAITITNTGSGGGSGLATRGNVNGTTGSLIDGATGTFDINAFKSYALYKIETDGAAWVRIYVDSASRTADAGRAEGDDPAPDAGVIAEVITTGAETVLISPGVFGFNNDTPVANTMYVAVTNKSGTTRTFTVTLTMVQLEA